MYRILGQFPKDLELRGLSSNSLIINKKEHKKLKKKKKNTSSYIIKKKIKKKDWKITKSNEKNELILARDFGSFFFYSWHDY